MLDGRVRGAVTYLAAREGGDLLWCQPFEIDLFSCGELGEDFAVEFCGGVYGHVVRVSIYCTTGK